jgi:WD40 repeat protein
MVLHPGDREATVAAVFLTASCSLVAVSAEGLIDRFDLAARAGPEPLVPCGSVRLPGRDVKVSALHCPVLSSFCFVGTARGNVFMLDTTEPGLRFTQWVIGSEKASKDGRPMLHKAAIVALETAPDHPNHLLVGYALGLIVLFDVKEQSAIHRMDYLATQDLRALAWHPSGDSFAAGLDDGRVAVWGSAGKRGDKPLAVLNAAAPDAPLRRPITRLVWTCDPGVGDEGAAGAAAAKEEKKEKDDGVPNPWRGAVLVAAGGGEQSGPADTLLWWREPDLSRSGVLPTSRAGTGSVLDMCGWRSQRSLLVLTERPNRVVLFPLPGALARQPASSTASATADAEPADPADEPVEAQLPWAGWIFDDIPRFSALAAVPAGIALAAGETGLGLRPGDLIRGGVLGEESGGSPASLLVTGHYDSCVRVWREHPASGIRLLSVLRTSNLVPAEARAQDCCITAFGFSESWRAVLVGSRAGVVLHFTLSDTGELDFESVVTSAGSPVSALAFDGKNKRFLVGTDAGQVLAVDFDTKKVTFSQKVTASAVCSITLSPASSALVVASAGGSVFLGDAVKPSFRGAFEMRTEDEASCPGILSVYLVDAEGRSIGPPSRLAREVKPEQGEDEEDSQAEMEEAGDAEDVEEGVVMVEKEEAVEEAGKSETALGEVQAKPSAAGWGKVAKKAHERAGGIAAAGAVPESEQPPPTPPTAAAAPEAPAPASPAPASSAPESPPAPEPPAPSPSASSAAASPSPEYLLVATRTHCFVLSFAKGQLLHKMKWAGACAAVVKCEVEGAGPVLAAVREGAHCVDVHSLMDLNNLVEGRALGDGEMRLALTDTVLGKIIALPDGRLAVPQVSGSLCIVGLAGADSRYLPSGLPSAMDPDLRVPDQPALEKQGLLRRKTALDEMLKPIASKGTLADQEVSPAPAPQPLSPALKLERDLAELLGGAQVPRLASREVSDARQKAHSSTMASMNAASSSANQARQQLTERGEKLQHLSDKFDGLNRAAMTFAQNASKLNKK